MGCGRKRILFSGVPSPGFEFLLLNEAVNRGGQLEQRRDRPGGVEVVVHRLGKCGGVLLSRGCEDARLDLRAGRRIRRRGIDVRSLTAKAFDAFEEAIKRIQPFSLTLDFGLGIFNRPPIVRAQDEESDQLTGVGRQ